MAIKEKDLPNAASIGGSDYVRMVTSDGESKKIEFDDVIPAGGSSGQVLTKSSGTDYDMGWSSPAGGIPSGGTTGQVLTKNSGTDYDVGWTTPSGGSGFTRTLLWTNTSTSSSFAAQTIPITNPSQFDVLEIQFVDSAPNAFIPMTNTNAFQVISSSWASNPNYRAFNRNANGLYCSDGYEKSQTTNNSIIKPYKVWGIKYA